MQSKWRSERRTMVSFVVLIAALGAAGCAQSDAPGAGTEAAAEASAADAARMAALEEIRESTSRFRDVNVALAEGYLPDPMNQCETAEMVGRPAELGVMGIHYFRPDLLGITEPPNPRVTGSGTHTDFLTPGVLIYEPQPDGSLELVAVENLVFVEAWEAAGNRAPPTFHGIPYDLMVDNPATPVDEAHNFAPHYDLHLWLHRDNPSGVTTPFNPNATCRHHVEGMPDHPI